MPLMTIRIRKYDADHEQNQQVAHTPTLHQHTTVIKPNNFTCLVTQRVESLIRAGVRELRHHCEVSQPAVPASADGLLHLLHCLE